MAATHSDTSIPPVKCAGILFRAPGPRYLLAKRSDNGKWNQPGGHIEEGESAEQAAVRECVEEIGGCPDGIRWAARCTPIESEDGDYICFVQDVPEAFRPKINDEHTAWGWFAPGELPKDILPPVAGTIARLTGNELDIAKRIVAGELLSPQKYENAWFFNLRVTGTGLSYRGSLKEYVLRPAEVFLTDEFVQRCNGLPVVFEHPSTVTLNTEEFRARSIGSITLPYIQGDEVWGIARINDADAAALMQTDDFASTSPAVVFREAGSTQTVEVDGKKVLLEGDPSYLDHLAICETGVWDKGGEPSGVNNGVSTMDETKEVKAEDQVPAWADALIKRCDEGFSAMNTRMDAYEGREKERKDSEKEEKRADAEEHLGFQGLEKKVEGEGYDKEAAEKIAGKVAQEKKADKKADSSEAEKDGEKERKSEEAAAKDLKKAEEEGEREHKAEERKDEESKEKEAKVDARADAQARENADLKRQIADMNARLSSLTRPLSASDRDELARAQARAESIAYMFGDSVTPPLHGESPISYRKRLAAKLQKHSEKAKAIKLESLDVANFDLIEERIYADAQAAARNPASMVAGRLIERKYADSAGRTITEYSGDPLACWGPFMSPGIGVRVNTPHAR